jgi:hypothetical protein
MKISTASFASFLPGMAAGSQVLQSSAKNMQVPEEFVHSYNHEVCCELKTNLRYRPADRE